MYVLEITSHFAHINITIMWPVDVFFWRTWYSVYWFAQASDVTNANKMRFFCSYQVQTSNGKYTFQIKNVKTSKVEESCQNLTLAEPNIIKLFRPKANCAIRNQVIKGTYLLRLFASDITNGVQHE